MNQPGPLPPVRPDDPFHLVTVGAMAWLFATIGYGEIVADAHNGAPDMWAIPAFLSAVFSVTTWHLRRKLIGDRT